MVIPSFCVIKLYYLGNYRGMALNYRGILTLEKVGLKLLRQFTVVMFYNIGPWGLASLVSNLIFESNTRSLLYGEPL
jgi:hypothetical protein